MLAGGPRELEESLWEFFLAARDHALGYVRSKGVRDDGIDAVRLVGQVYLRASIKIPAYNYALSVKSPASLPITVDDDLIILGASARVNVAPIGSSITLTILKNGTPITSTGQLFILDGSNVGYIGGNALLDRSATAEDSFTINVVSVGSGTAGSGLVVSLRVLVPVHIGAPAVP